MKTTTRKHLLITAFIPASLLALALTATPFQLIQAQTAPAATGTVRYQSVPKAGECKVEGTSTLKDWWMKASQISGAIEADADFPESTLADPAKSQPVIKRVRIPLSSLKADDKPAMDTKMQEHMEITKYPNVEYNLIELKPKSPAGTKGAIQFDAVGTLNIYGKTVTNTMPVTIEKKDGKLTVTGSTPLKMSDYGIPKVSAFGMSTGDELKISFTWVTAPKAKPAP